MPLIDPNYLRQAAMGRVNQGLLPAVSDEDYAAMLERLQKEREFNITRKDRGNANMLETWPAGEEGTPDYARPEDLPMDKLGLEINSDQVGPKDIVGDLASHDMAQNDPNMTGYYREFERSLTPQQHDKLQEQYRWAVDKEGETRPYEEWYQASGLPAYFRGGAFKQWDNPDQYYTPDQQHEQGRMLQYLQTGKPPEAETSGLLDQGNLDQGAMDRVNQGLLPAVGPSRWGGEGLGKSEPFDPITAYRGLPPKPGEAVMSAAPDPSFGDSGSWREGIRSAIAGDLPGPDASAGSKFISDKRREAANILMHGSLRGGTADKESIGGIDAVPIVGNALAFGDALARGDSTGMAMAAMPLPAASGPMLRIAQKEAVQALKTAEKTVAGLMVKRSAGEDVTKELNQARLQMARARSAKNEADKALKRGDRSTKPTKREEERAVNLSLHRTTTPQEIMSKTAANTGYSVHLGTGEIPLTGLMMGRYANKSKQTQEIPGQMSREDILKHARINKTVLEAPENYFGTWIDRDVKSGAETSFLDVARRFPEEDMRKAVKFGEGTGQKAGFNLTTGKGFKVRNWGKWIRGKTFHKRMDDMYAKGSSYMADQPTKNWWPIEGSSFERVYGKENLPQVAGFLGVTSSNTAPRPNVQVMSEYMRRHMKGEAVLQPEYRIPETAMGGSSGPGKRMPMEGKIGPDEPVDPESMLGHNSAGRDYSIGGRAKNLVRASEGDYKNISGDVMRGKAEALMGEDTGVLDRWWARIAEDVRRNVFSGPEEGAIQRQAGPNRPYMQLLNQVMIGAQRHGVTVAEYSANVWVGIRETVKETGKLFGTKYEAGAISGESKSYIDHFEDLIREKAKHLGITVEELEKRLRAGDAELLSVMLSIPTIGAMFAASSGDHERSVPTKEGT